MRGISPINYSLPAWSAWHNTASKHGISLDKPPQLRSVISPSLNEIFMASPDKRSPVITTMTLLLDAI